MSIQIESDIPLPNTGPRNSTYPWSSMKTGDSFAMPHDRVATLRGAANVRGARNNEKYSVRVVVENGVKVARCWRTA